MFGHRIKLFNLFGFPVRVDVSWLFIAVLISWSLAEGVFPHYAEGLSTTTYWAMGIGGALLLFASIVLHELGHALVARRNGLPMKGITLFIFGGVGEMTEEPETPGAEFSMAIVGPIISIALGGLFYLATLAPWSKPVSSVFGYLAAINLVLAGFNLVPAFPLDGGRVLRSALWAWKGKLRWATGVASQVGSAFGIALMVLAVMNLLSGMLVGAIWWFILGMFVRGAAKMSYQQVVWRQLLSDTKVGKLMHDEPHTVPPDITIEEFVDEYLYRYHHKMFPVTCDGELLGCISTAEIKELSREEWPSHTVGDLLQGCTDETCVSRDADATAALKVMHNTGRSRLLVVDGDALAGVITLKDLSTYISRRTELEGDRFGGVSGGILGGPRDEESRAA
jgi:Zn-dependent protease